MGTHTSDYTTTCTEYIGVYGKEWKYELRIANDVIATDLGFTSREQAYDAAWNQKHNEIAIRSLRASYT